MRSPQILQFIDEPNQSNIIVMLLKNRTFWLYHLAGLIAVASIDSMTILFAPHLTQFKLLASWVIWPPLFTCAVLGFRWVYLRYGLSVKSVLQLVPIIIAYATVCSIIASITMNGILLPFFWVDFVPPDVAARGEVNLIEVGLPMTTGAALSGQVFIVAWIFIYVSIIQGRSAQEQALRAVRLQNALKESQLATLQNQLNPHFLFNALNNIRFVIHEDADTADRMLTTLSELLRYSLSTSEQSKVSLVEELKMTQRYVDLIKLQYEDKLQFDVHIELDPAGLFVPPMSVQTLVENSVKHGLEALPKGGRVSVAVEPVVDDPSSWSITVTNPIPDEPKPLKQGENSGTGLKNIQHRLQLLFGERAVLKTKHLPGQYVAHILLPRDS